jgi:hypothetical protein
MMRFILEERLGWGKEVGVSRDGRFASKGIPFHSDLIPMYQ